MTKNVRDKDIYADELTMSQRRKMISLFNGNYKKHPTRELDKEQVKILQQIANEKTDN